jgi:class 3 adenylate cyclase
MKKGNEKELVKRIAKLAKQNQQLRNKIKELQRLSEKAGKENEKFKALLAQIEPQKLTGLKKETPQQPLVFKMSTVLFAEIQGITNADPDFESDLLLDELDEIFFEFNASVKKFNIEKIKSIGDTYMCAGGIPVKNITNPVEVVLAALEMRDFIDSYERITKNRNEKIWKIKFGIHTGPVIAEFMGKKKISYDIKGDTVNTASRIQSNADHGKIIISIMTYELVKEFFNCEYFGRIPAKYKGDMDLFEVKGLKPEFSEDENGIVPNHAFRVKFGLIQFSDMQEIILDKLEKELPEHLFYHNVKHTVDVVTEVELIGWAEGVSDEEILLLKAAGLFHDAGHTIAYKDHEMYGTKLAREILPKFGYSVEMIDRICEIIMATKLPPQPGNLLEDIICDADLDYLGRSDFIPVSNTLYKELKVQNMIGSLNDWNKLQVKFISGHQYFTETARNLREVNKQKQIERISRLIVDGDD